MNYQSIYPITLLLPLRVEIKSTVLYMKHIAKQISDFHIEMLEHNQEEADTIIILHSNDVARKDRSTKLTIVSPDADVFLLLIYFYPNLCTSTIFRTGKKDKARDIDIGCCFWP